MCMSLLKSIWSFQARPQRCPLPLTLGVNRPLNSDPNLHQIDSSVIAPLPLPWEPTCWVDLAWYCVATVTTNERRRSVFPVSYFNVIELTKFGVFYVENVKRQLDAHVATRRYPPHAHAVARILAWKPRAADVTSGFEPIEAFAWKEK